MVARLPGWGDEDVLALLALFCKHLRHYIYTSDMEFINVMHAELPDKPGREIQEMVKSLMLQFGLVLSTKNFRNEVIVMNGNEIFVHEHVYESISQLPENKAGDSYLCNFDRLSSDLPDIIYDPTSVAHKIFNADWTNVNDPYALGYLAFKTR
ncbi:hypothetical protein BBO99_00000600 [Phytophthora kernoviae]|uniref:Uncharacterized protein n=2 Tax=Phytophthora kernoviae TaxID=325452 RepID=A0A3R7JZ65_9STRA|nr:hypothetical protein G195_001607 [Phytophthora kernoviae 00238/432]KAG2523620.1 hypothetical protein JM16_005305 [Phytophthora kernoviae]KAG2532931.1 hypothetical protein JM18_000926 [Phytophthora kernoviae]RLN20467.1 hypothetical protein BBI17_005495 [Phytophthora kernoviae]RLN85386.1 hypothetical protein BBO99_00000600 [Phytophthora kernoviae]